MLAILVAISWIPLYCAIAFGVRQAHDFERSPARPVTSADFPKRLSEAILPVCPQVLRENTLAYWESG